MRSGAHKHDGETQHNSIEKWEEMSIQTKWSSLNTSNDFLLLVQNWKISSISPKISSFQTLWYVTEQKEKLFSRLLHFFKNCTRLFLDWCEGGIVRRIRNNLSTSPAIHLLRLWITFNFVSSRVDTAFWVFKVLQSLAVAFKLFLKNSVLMLSTSLVELESTDAVQSLQIEPSTESYTDSIHDQMWF